MAETDLNLFLITEDCFKYEQECGPKKEHRQYFPNKLDPVSPDAKEVSCLFPKETFRPEVYAVFDFAHTFVETSAQDTAQQQKEKRLVHPDLLADRAKKLRRFMKGYLSTPFEYGKNQEYDFEGDSRYYLASEEDQVYYINNVINYFITDFQITRTRKQISTATISMKDTRNVRNNKSVSAIFEHVSSIFYQLFVPMVPVTIWAKGRLYDQWFFPIFDGYVTSVNPTGSAGFAELQLMCKDMLELARISMEMVNPGLIQYAEDRRVNAVNLQAKPFYGHDHLELVKRLFVGGSLEFNPTNSKTREATFSILGDIAGSLAFSMSDYITAGVTQGRTEYAIRELGKRLKVNTLDLMKLENLEFMCPSEGTKDSELEDGLSTIAINREDFSMSEALKRVSHKTNPRKVFVWGDRITPFRTWNWQNPSIQKSDFSSRLDVLTEIADSVYFDYYVDGGGNFHYNPYRLSNHFLNSEAIYKNDNDEDVKIPWAFPHSNVIPTEEVITDNELLNVEELVTFLKVIGRPPEIALPDYLSGVYGSALDRQYLNRFGYRRQYINSPLFNFNFPIPPKKKPSTIETWTKFGEAFVNQIKTIAGADSSEDESNDNENTEVGGLSFGDLLAAMLIKWHNAELHTRQTQMIFRPELEVGAPAYFVDNDTVFYVNSITHTISIGGQATSSVNLSFGRKVYEPPPDLMSFMLITQRIYTNRSLENADVETFLTQLPVNNWTNYLDNRAQFAYRMAIGKTMEDDEEILPGVEG